MTASASVVEVLRHYACSCEPGDCAMSADDTDVPVDDVLCGRRAAEALAVLTTLHPAREAVVQTLSDEFGKIETSEVVQRAADAILALAPQPAEQDAREAVAWRFKLADDDEWDLCFVDPRCDTSDFAKVQPLFSALTQAAPDGWRPIETAPKDGRNILAWGYLHDDGGPYETDGRSFMGETPHEMVVYFSPEHSVWRDRSHGGSYAGLTHWQPLPPAPPAQGEGG